MKVEVVKTNVPGLPLRISGDLKPKPVVGAVAAMHLHDDIEILAGYSGNLEVCIDEKIDLRAGDVIVINRRVPHSTAKTVPFTSTIMLQFRIEKIHPEEFENINKYLALILSSNGKRFIYLPREEKLTGEVYYIIKSMHEESCAQRENYEMFVRGYMDILLGTLYRNGILDNIGEGYDKDALRKIWPVIEYIDKNYNREISLSRLAETMDRNKEYFCRLFKKNMGVSYLQYVYQVRTTAFCRELESTEDPISEIAERHGFRDPKMLNQYFREIYGCTPSEKRKFFREVTIEDSDDPEED